MKRITSKLIVKRTDYQTTKVDNSKCTFVGT